ncbi:MAG: hypothetical protein JWR15_57 [Prosthecobacter sp.]|nr:hypothetical protein [Prosthecobacter sp.]
MKHLPLRPLLVLYAFHCLVGCNLLPGYQAPHVPAQQVTQLKSDSLEIMSKATDPYPLHALEAGALKNRLGAARDTEAKAKRNQAAIDLWAKMNDPAGGLLGGFLADWEKRGKVSSAFIPEKKDEVGAAFDTIAKSSQPAKK